MGSTPGAGSVSASGAATYSIPISTPPGTNGVVPSLSIEYNSMSGNGVLGMGWNISGMSSISRTGRNMYFDNVTAAVELSQNDRFSLDGQRLIVKSGDYGSPNSTYGTESENFATVTARASQGGGPQYFEVLTKDGVLMEFGKTSDSRFMDVNNNTVLFWRINKILNPDGNYIKYVYTNEDRDPRLSEIHYTGNEGAEIATYTKIEFSYKIRQNSSGFADIKTLYEAGSTIVSKYLLDAITVQAEESLVKKYQFNYGHDNINSYLKEVVETGSDGTTTLNPTVFKYGDSPQDFVKETGPTLPQPKVDFFSGDFDGNGKSDIVMANYTEYPFQNSTYGWIVKKYTGFNIYRDGNPSNASGLINLADGTQINSNANNANTHSFLTADFNGDGLDDILTSKIGTTVSQGATLPALEAVTIYRSSLTPNGMLGDQFQVSPVGGGLFIDVYDNLLPENGNYLFNGDFDGDGAQELITLLGRKVGGYRAIHYQADPRTLAHDNFDIVNDSDNSLLAGSWALAKKIRVLDFNGDGKDDLMTIQGGTTRIYSYTNYKSGGYSGFKLLYSSSSFLKSTDPDILFGDFNGDGKTDILYKEYADGNQNNLPWYLATSTGTDYIKTSFVFASTVGVLPENEILHVADFNGDGRSDVYHQYKPSYSLPSKGDVYYSRGNGFYSQQFTLDVDAANGRPSIPTDLDGDGKAQILFRQYNTNNLAIISLKKSGKENLLEKVENGMGHVTTWTYQSLAEGGSFYNKGAVSLTDYPFHKIQLPMQAVSTFNDQNGTNGQYSTYSYEQARLHRAGKGFIGFGKTTGFDIVTGYKTVSENEFNSTFYVAIPKKTKTTYNAHDGLISQSILSNEVVDLGSKRYLLKTTGVENTMLGGGVTTTSNTIDTNGNITSSTVSAGPETITTATEYGAYPAGIPNKPTLITVTRTRSGETPYETKTKYDYNDKGQLSSKVDFWTKAKAVTTSYGYNNRGNLVSTTISATGLTDRTSSASYDSKGRYPETSTDALGFQSAAVYNAKWGTPTSVTGIDGLVTTNTYDAFGRNSSTSVFGDYTVTSAPAWDIFENKVWKTVTTYSQAGRASVTEWFDIVGRSVRTQTAAFGTGTIESNTVYEGRGNVSHSEQPHKSAESFITSIHTYDDYKRPDAVSAGALGTTSYSYSHAGGNTTVTTNTPSGSSSKTTDITGKVTSATDNGGNLTYTYYSHGGLKEVRNGATLLTANEYDEYGRQTKLTDANAGATEYSYNAFGELTWQKSAKGDVHTMNYDVAGRVTSRSGPEGTTTYEYYTTDEHGGKSKGKIKKETGFETDNFTEYRYDNRGRVGWMNEKVDNQDHVTTYAYNIFGDLTQTNHASGFVEKHAYDSNGYLTTIKNASNHTLYSTSAMNGQGQVTAYNLGNGKSSSIEYQNGMPTRYHTDGIQDLRMEWDYGKGNLNKRSDVSKNKEESFGYDNLDRLTSANIAGGVSFSASYAANGNINSKTDAGNYNYHGTKFNATTGASNPGNTIPAVQQDISYTAFQQPHIVTEGAYKLTYTYGADYNRIKSELKQNDNTIQTRYYFSNFEKDGSGRQINYISAPVGLIAIVENSNIHYTYTDHLGSILTVTNGSGNIEAEQNFDAWGRRRDPNSWALLAPTASPSLPDWLYRGYTGHEHLDQFGLINMNGRMYDPVLGRMLSTDNYVADGGFTQDYNRYTYARNNPLVYTDPDGQFALLFGMAAGQFAGMAAGMIVGGITAYNVAKNNGATTNQAILAGFGGAVVGGAIGYGLGSIDYGSLFGGGAGSGASGYSTSLGGSLSGVNNSLFQGAIGGAGLSLGNYLDQSRFVNRAPDHLSASIGDPPQTWRDPKTGKPLASGAVESNTWIEETLLGGKAIGGTLKLGSMAWGAIRGAAVARNVANVGYQATSTAIRSALADRVGKRGFSEVGYQFQKHFGRGGAWANEISSATKLNPATFNRAGYETFKKIWRAPGSFKRVGGFLEKRLPDGRGIRLQENWQFKGFID